MSGEAARQDYEKEDKWNETTWFKSIGLIFAIELLKENNRAKPVLISLCVAKLQNASTVKSQSYAP